MKIVNAAQENEKEGWKRYKETIRKQCVTKSSTSLVNKR